MSAVRRRSAALVVAVAVLAAGCGLDDGARVRNQDNVREDSVRDVETEEDGG